MKKIILFLCIFMCSCANNDIDYIHDKSPEERIEAINSEYSKVLTSPADGWKVYFRSENGVGVGSWLVLMKFKTDGTIEMKCDPVDLNAPQILQLDDDKVTYRLDFSLSSELVIESYSQFSAWVTATYDSDGNGTIDAYAGGESQFVIDKYEDEKLYLHSKLDLGRDNADISQFVFEKATAEDWNFSDIEKVKSALNNIPLKGFENGGTVVGPLLSFNVNYRVAYMYDSFEAYKVGDEFTSHPFYITKTGITFIEPFSHDKFSGTFENFNVDIVTGVISKSDDPKLTLYGFIPPRIDISGEYTFKATNYFGKGVLTSPPGKNITIEKDPNNEYRYIIKNGYYLQDGSIYPFTGGDDIYIDESNSIFNIPTGQNLGNGSLMNFTEDGRSPTAAPIVVNVDGSGNLRLLNALAYEASSGGYYYIMLDPVLFKVN